MAGKKTARGLKPLVLLYLDFVRIGLMEGLAWRLRSLLQLLSYPVIILANYYLYHAVFANRPPGAAIAGHSLEQTISYIVIAWTLRSIFWTRIDQRLGERVRSGDVAVDLIRPVSFALSQWCHSVGTSIQRLFTITLPLLAVAALFLHVTVPTTGGRWLLLAASVALGYLVMTLTKLLVGVLAFYLEYNENLRFSFEILQRLLGGLMIPLSFFPEPVFAVLRGLPFQYIYYIPAEVCLGKVSDPVVVLLVPALWVGGLAGACALGLRAGMRRLTVQGG